MPVIHASLLRSLRQMMQQRLLLLFLCYAKRSSEVNTTSMRMVMTVIGTRSKCKERGWFTSEDKKKKKAISHPLMTSKHGMQWVTALVQEADQIQWIFPFLLCAFPSHGDFLRLGLK